MKYFKLPPINIIEVHDQSLWLNKHITINNKLIFWKQWQKHGINTINNLLDNENIFLAHTEINHKFGIKCTYLDITQIQSSIPKTWKQIIKIRHTNSSTENTVTLKICINNQYKDIQKTKCKDFYCHVINSRNHNTRSKLTWSKTFKNLPNPEESTWKNIYNIPFKTVIETKIQTIQYRYIMHGVLHTSLNKLIMYT